MPIEQNVDNEIMKKPVVLGYIRLTDIIMVALYSYLKRENDKFLKSRMIFLSHFEKRLPHLSATLQ